MILTRPLGAPASFVVTQVPERFLLRDEGALETVEQLAGSHRPSDSSMRSACV